MCEVQDHPLRPVRTSQSQAASQDKTKIARLRGILFAVDYPAIMGQVVCGPRAGTHVLPEGWRFLESSLCHSCEHVATADQFVNSGPSGPRAVRRYS